MSYHKNANGRTATNIDALLEKANTALQSGHVDTDTATTSLHHTLGDGANQAANGDKTARARRMAKILFGGL